MPASYAHSTYDKAASNELAAALRENIWLRKCNAKLRSEALPAAKYEIEVGLCKQQIKKLTQTISDLVKTRENKKTIQLN